MAFPLLPAAAAAPDPSSLPIAIAVGGDNKGNDKIEAVGIRGGAAVIDEALKAPVVEISVGDGRGGEEGGEGEDEEDDDDGEEDDDDGEDNDEDSDEARDEDGWEDESLFEDLIDGVGGDENEDDDNRESHGGEDRFSPSESLHLRKRLRLIGESRFLHETIGTGTCTAKELCTAFGVVRPPFFLEAAPDEAYFTLLSVCISRELRRRVKLQEWNTIDDAVELLKGRGKVVVLTGAGISTSLGIPDFRSKDTGLYARLEHLGLSDPQEVFDIHLFHQDPSIFYSVAKDILPSSKKFTPTHAFIRLLQDKGKLLTNFTQNIDNLEEFAGIEKERLVQCHGSFATATCIECRHQVACEAIYEDLKAGKVAHCEECLQRIRRPITTITQQQAPFMKRKRSSDGTSSDVKSQKKARKKKTKRKKQDYEDSTTDDDDDDHLAAVTGVMKPDITFFGEDLPPRFHDRLVNHDRSQVDLVLVIGTSLKVAPVSEIVGVIPPHVPQIYISREACKHVEFDIDLLGDCDVIVQELCQRAGWDLRHEMIASSSNGKGDEAVAVELVEGQQSRWLMKFPAASADTEARTNGVEPSSPPLPRPASTPTIEEKPEEKTEGVPQLVEPAAVGAGAG